MSTGTRPTGYAPSLSGSSSSSQKARKVSSGRGGAGNLVKPSMLVSGLEQDTEVMERRKQETAKNINMRVKAVYTGRGGNGNISAASNQLAVPFDTSLDPDDAYDQIVLQKAKEARISARSTTGRGGTGNVTGKKPKMLQSQPRSEKRRALWRGSNLSTSSSNLSTSSSNLSTSFSNLSTPSSNLSSSSQSSRRQSLDNCPPSPRSLYQRPKATNSIQPLFTPPPPDILHSSEDDELLDVLESPNANKKAKWWKLRRRMPDSPSKGHSRHPPVPELVHDISRRSEDIDARTIRPDHDGDEEEDRTPSPTPAQHQHFSIPNIQVQAEEDEEYYSDSDAYDPYTPIEDIDEDDVSAYELEVIREAQDEAALFETALSS